ncbi:UNVERIFIED_CONTAM: hypothetical protein PYX00_000447 [Menopon gallinae]|uniref:Outer dense fiber protein 3B n=1 Tax=Menopon gallinae TaxID=328185 RepID=A0AAW2I9B1_9NEOP
MMGECGGRTPGPAYALATLTGYVGHDYSKNRAPAYSLGLRPTRLPIGQTPGPYKIGNVDRNGRYPNLGWTMESKARNRVYSIGPGPLAYAPEKMRYYTPAYSLGLRTTCNLKPFGPSAADYYPQPLGTGPAYTIGSARRATSKFSPPGPQAATPLERYKPKAPAFSMGLKGRGPASGSPGPGPKYYPGNCCHKTSHAYSFGLKHSKCAPPLITYEDTDLC